MIRGGRRLARGAGVIDLLAFILVWGRVGAPIHSIRRDDCFQDCGTHALKALGDDGSKIELDQSETTMRELSSTATAHWIVPVG
jgi:hypothetical protein